MRIPPGRRRRRRAVALGARARRPRSPGDATHRRGTARPHRRRRLRRRRGQPVSARCWMSANLTTQGYALSERERGALWLGLRFSTGLCLTLVVTALALPSVVMLV